MDKRKAIAAEIPRLRRYARALQRDPASAEDLVQDCMERALSRLHLFKSGTNMRAWLFTILHNVHANSVRRQQRSADSFSFDNNSPAEGVNQPSQGHGLELRDVSRAIARLSEEQRQAVLLIGLEEMSYQEAADMLAIPIGTVMSRLARGRERLRQLTGGEDTKVLRRVK